MRFNAIGGIGRPQGRSPEGRVKTWNSENLSQRGGDGRQVFSFAVSRGGPRGEKLQSVGGPQNGPDLGVLDHELPQPVIVPGVLPGDVRTGERQVAVGVQTGRDPQSIGREITFIHVLGISRGRCDPRKVPCRSRRWTACRTPNTRRCSPRPSVR